jgi:hypothetical protein
MSRLDPDTAVRMLDGDDLLPVAQAGLAEAKQIVDACLDHGVPALLGRDDHCTKGCSPKVLILARPDDIGRVQAILQKRWASLVASVDHEVAAAGVGHEVTGEGEPPCPACGTSAALVGGACPECGLQLA